MVLGKLRRLFCFREISSDRLVILSGHCEGCGGEFITCFQRGSLMLLNFFKHTVVLLRIGDDGRKVMILSCGSNQTRTTNINLFDCFGTSYICPSDGCSKGIQIYND